MRPTQAIQHRQGGTVDEIGVRRDDDGTQLRLILSGPWTIARIGALERQLQVAMPAAALALPAQGSIDATGLGKIDTAGAWLLQKCTAAMAQRGCTLSYVGLRREQQSLLEEVARADAGERTPVTKVNPLSRLAGDLLATLDGIIKDLTGLITFFGMFVSALSRVVTFRSRFRWTAFVHHLEHAGLRALPIIALICVLIGAVVMQQGALQLATYGAEPYAASMLGVLALREIGVLLTAVMVAGRSASAFTAEIGSMKMREEIDAMRTLGIDPVETLVIPRIMALLVALPLLTFAGDIMCLAGGAFVAVFLLDQSMSVFLDGLHAGIEPRHFFAGMIKTPFAALVIGLVGCSEGLKVAGSAESLGRHVTSAVVKAIFLVIILGALFAMFLVSMGI